MAQWKVYLSGEIHSDWRRQIIEAAASQGLAVEFSGPVTDHSASDECGVRILGPEQSSFWTDQKGSTKSTRKLTVTRHSVTTNSPVRGSISFEISNLLI